MARRILITGAKGFVGTHLCSALATAHPEDELFRLAAPQEASSREPVADLLNVDAVDKIVESIRPDIVVHLAAQASVARTTHDAGPTFAVNLGGSLHLALAVARHVPSATLLFVSSSEVYGASFLSGPVVETTPLLPMNAYAKSKRLAEDMFAAVLPLSTRLIVARPFNHTGAAQREDFVLPSFAHQVARIEAGQQPPRLMVGNVEVSRDFLDVRDVVAAYLALLDAAPKLPPRFTCNVSSGQALPLRERIETLNRLCRVPFEIVVDPSRTRPVDLPVAVGDSSLLRLTTGWAPQIGMVDTLRDLLEAARRRLSAAAE